MKLYGVFGKGSGKVGNSVWAISGGEQIVRPYNPNVTNPNTDAQVEQRAKLKLMSQLAADLSSVLAFKKSGLVSARNKFVSANIKAVTVEQGVAEMPLTEIQIAEGSQGIALPRFERVEQSTNVDVIIANGIDANVKSVVLVLAEALPGSRLRVVDVKVVTREDDSSWPDVEMTGVAGEMLLMQYGVKSGSASASVDYNSYEVSEDTLNAALSFIASIRLSGATFTKNVNALIAEQA